MKHSGGTLTGIDLRLSTHGWELTIIPTHWVSGYTTWLQLLTSVYFTAAAGMLSQEFQNLGSNIHTESFYYRLQESKNL